MIPPATLTELEKLRKPMPGRADACAAAVAADAGGFDGAVARIWPAMVLVLSVSSGSFSVYATKLRRYLGDGIPIYSPLYAATEGVL